MLGHLWDHFGQLACMALIIFSAQGITRRVQRGRLRAEAQRLRSALIPMCRALRELHADNLRVLAGAKPPLMSGRLQISLLRTQLGRLLTLDQPEVEAVVAANIAVERAEAIMTVSGKSVRGVAFTPPKEAEEMDELKSVLMHACAMLEAAEMLMTPGAEADGKAELDAPNVQLDAPNAELDAPNVELDAPASRDFGSGVHAEPEAQLARP